MPIYEYQCTDCEHKLEALQKISDQPLTECPECNAPKLEKLVSAASFRLKGSGWYETDFKTGDKKQLADSESSPPVENKKEGEKKEKSNSESKEQGKSATANKSQETTAKPASKTAGDSS
jgi:putative FmdB family regulatory protein